MSEPHEPSDEKILSLCTGVQKDALATLLSLGLGDVTMMFTDIKGSTSLKKSVGGDREYFQRVKDKHDKLLQECILHHGGHILNVVGDSFFAGFDDARRAIGCALEIQRSLEATPIATPQGNLAVRIGIHTGEPVVYENEVVKRTDLTGNDVDMAARIEALADGGQILLSQVTAALVAESCKESGYRLHSHGLYTLKGIGEREVFEVLWGSREPRKPAPAVETGSQPAPPAPATPDALIGMTLGGCKILSCIGRGGMGAVYKAEQLKLDRIVALKVMLPGLAADRSYVERFMREARIAAQLNHPNVVQIHDVGEEGGWCFVVMEFVEGSSVKLLIRKMGKLPPRQALAILLQVTKGLDAAHKKGMIHRDIKPANLLISKDGIVKLADFGLARAIASSSQMTQSGAVMGTPHYMSPEQGQALPVDIRTDIYALGVSLFEMLTGTLPFEGDTPVSVILKHIQAPLPDTLRADPAIPPAVASLVEKMMAKKPEERYSSPAELAADIKLILQGKTPEALKPPVAPAPSPVGREAVASPVASDPLRAGRESSSAPQPSVKDRLAEMKARKKGLGIIGWGIAAAGLLLLAVVLALVLRNGAGRTSLVKTGEDAGKTSFEKEGVPRTPSQKTSNGDASETSLQQPSSPAGTTGNSPGRRPASGQVLGSGKPNAPVQSPAGTTESPNQPAVQRPKTSAASALAAARELETKSPSDLETILFAYEQITRQYPDSEEAKQAAEKLKALRAALDANKAKEESKAAVESARKLAAELKYADALRTLDAFSEKYPDTDAAKEAKALTTEIAENAEKKYKELEAKALALAKENKPDEAKAVLAPVIESFGIKEYADKATALLDDLGKKTVDSAAPTKSPLPPGEGKGEGPSPTPAPSGGKAYETFAASLAEPLKKRDYAKALELCKAALAQPSLSARVSSDIQNIETLIKFYARASKNAELLVGKPFTPKGGLAGTVKEVKNGEIVVTTGQASFNYPIVKMDAEALVALFDRDTKGYEPAEAAYAKALFYNAEGDTPKAVETLQQAKETVTGKESDRTLAKRIESSLNELAEKSEAEALRLYIAARDLAKDEKQCSKALPLFKKLDDLKNTNFYKEYKEDIEYYHLLAKDNAALKAAEPTQAQIQKKKAELRNAGYRVITVSSTMKADFPGLDELAMELRKGVKSKKMAVLFLDSSQYAGNLDASKYEELLLTAFPGCPPVLDARGSSISSGCPSFKAGKMILYRAVVDPWARSVSCWESLLTKCFIGAGQLEFTSCFIHDTYRGEGWNNQGSWTFKNCAMWFQTGWGAGRYNRICLYGCTAVGKSEGFMHTDQLPKVLNTLVHGFETAVSYDGSGSVPLENISYVGYSTSGAPFKNCRGLKCERVQPDFVAPEKGDFRLKPGSPLLKMASDKGPLGVRWSDEQWEWFLRALRRVDRIEHPHKDKPLPGETP